MKNSQVHVSLAGGLGNQLFQISAALKLTQADIIVHDFLKNARRTETGDPEINQFNLPKRVTYELSQEASRLEKRYINYLYGLGASAYKARWKFLEKFAVNLAPLIFSRLLNKKVKVIVARDLGDFDYTFPDCDVVIVGYFQSWAWSTALGEWAESGNLKLVAETENLPILRKKVEAFIICLHIRRGDYKYEPKIGLLSRDYFNKALEFLVGEKLNVEIWLFSDDDLDLNEWVDSKFISKVLRVPNAPTPLTFQAMRNADAYVISNSTFSWWAARTSFTNSPIVVAPTPWFKELNSPTGILPMNWIKNNSLFI